MENIISETDGELRSPKTSKERVQELFQKWWEMRIGWAVLEGEYGDERWVFPVKFIERIGTIGAPVPHLGFLHFPKDKLWGQTDRILRGRSARPVDDRILQAAGRCASLGLHFSCDKYLEDNIVYMLSSILGDDQHVTQRLIGLSGGLRDYLNYDIPVAARVTYALGKTAKEYVRKSLDDLGVEGTWDMLTNTYLQAKAEAKGMDFSKYDKDEEEITYYQRVQDWKAWKSKQETAGNETVPSRKESSTGAGISWSDFSFEQRDSNNDGQRAEKELTDSKTPEERIQTLFDRWLKNRQSLVLKEDGFYMFHAWYEPERIIGSSGPIVPPHALLHFQESKLRENQIAQLERCMRPRTEEDKGC